MAVINEIEISVVMPCLNEAETLEGCIREALNALEKNGAKGEVVVADNGSSDGSPDIAEKAGARIVNVSQKGYGNALRKGIEAARGTFVLMGDADGSYDFGELPRFLEQLRQGDDLVMGCRFPRHGGSIQPGAMPWKHRWIGNPVLSSLGKLFFSSPVMDFHCGLRAFRRKAIMNLGLRTSGMEFASEMVVKATLNKLRISQIPITLRCDGRSRSPHLRSWRDGWRHLRFMLLYSPVWLFVLPGLCLSLSGILGFIFLLPEPLTLFNGVTFDLNTLLVSGSAILVGFQVLSFGLFVKIYAINTGMLPGESPWLKIVKHHHTVEWGIGIGFLLMAVGFIFLITAILEWKTAGFGPLSYQESLRIVIPAVTGIGLGMQVVASGFVLAILGVDK